MRYITRSDLLVVASNSGLLMIGIGVMCLIPLLFDLVYFEFDIVSFAVPAAILPLRRCWDWSPFHSCSEEGLFCQRYRGELCRRAILFQDKR